YTQVSNTSQAFATDASGAPLLDASGNGIITSPILDTTSKWGTIYGTYLQDEWRLTNQLTVIAGLRFDEMVPFVTANQLSPPIAAINKRGEETTSHAARGRTLTPPSQGIGTPATYNLSNTAPAQAAITVDSPPPSPPPLAGEGRGGAATRSGPVLPERAN